MNHRKRTVEEKIANFKKEFRDDYPWVDMLDQASWGQHYFLIFPTLDLYDGDQDDETIELIHQLENFVENNSQMLEIIGFENIKVYVLYNTASQQTHGIRVTCKDQNIQTLAKLIGINGGYMLL